MSRVRFLADHDVRGPILDGLFREEPTLDIIRLRDVLDRETPDDAVLAFAAIDRRVVLSHDLKTMSATAALRIKRREPMTGLLLARQHLPIATVIDSVLKAWLDADAEDWVDRIKYAPL